MAAAKRHKHLEQHLKRGGTRTSGADNRSKTLKRFTTTYLSTHALLISLAQRDVYVIFVQLFVAFACDAIERHKMCFFLLLPII